MGGKVLIFDSGVGGLSIVTQLMSELPGLQLHYLSDNAAFPYGEKEEGFLLQRVPEVLDKALGHVNADIVIIACNTASTIALEEVRSRLHIPVVGVVPAIKTAAALTKSGVFGLLATPGTIRRSYTKQLISEFAGSHSVISVGSGELVQFVENFLMSGHMDDDFLHAILNQFNEHPESQQMDTVVLGCTHFPLIQAQLSKLRPDWRWVDSTGAIVNRVRALLSHPEALEVASGHTALLTEAESIGGELPAVLAKRGFPTVKVLTGLAD